MEEAILTNTILSEKSSLEYETWDEATWGDLDPNDDDDSNDNNNNGEDNNNDDDD